MKLIDTRIDTMQVELAYATKEIKQELKCDDEYVFLDTSLGTIDAFVTPEALLATDGFMISDILKENGKPECTGDIFFRVSVVVDAFRRDDKEPRFSRCDENEIKNALNNHRKKQEAESDKEDDGFTMLEGMPFKADKLVYYNAKTGKPDSYRTVIALTDNGFWFAGRYQEDAWKFKDGGVFDPEAAGGEVVAWFEVPTLHKIQ